MEPGKENAGHSHTLVEEILIVKSGTEKIQIENDSFDLCAGSVAKRLCLRIENSTLVKAILTKVAFELNSRP